MAVSSSGATVAPAADAPAGPWSATEAVYRPCRRAILPGPCDSSRSARSRDRTSTGSRRWSSSRSPSAGGGRGTASATRRVHARVRLGAAVPASDWPDGVAGDRRLGPSPAGRPCRWRRRPGRSTGPRSPGTGSSPGRWSPWSAGGPSPRRPSPSPSASVSPARPGDPHRRASRGSSPAHGAAIADASLAPPTWIRDADRRIPIVSISGTNGKSTVTRLITHILVLAGRHVGTTTSDGILVDERMVEAGDWTGPGGAARILERHDVDVAVLETARGGIMLRGVGYESNDASVLTNVSSDHLDLQGIHTLPELAEVKADDRPDDPARGWAILNADDQLRGGRRPAACARTSRSSRSTADRSPRGPPPSRAAAAAPTCSGAGRSWRSTEPAGAFHEIARGPRHPDHDRRPGPPQHRERAGRGRRRAGPRARRSRTSATGCSTSGRRPTGRPGGSTSSGSGARLVIVDFAHNEAGISALLDVAEGIAGGAAGRAAPITAIIGTAGDRPDDTLRGIGRIAAQRAQRVVIKETCKYLRGRTRESVVGELLAGAKAGGGRRADGLRGCEGRILRFSASVPRTLVALKSMPVTRAAGQRRACLAACDVPQPGDQDGRDPRGTGARARRGDGPRAVGRRSCQRRR